jgi:hypothetical protein
MKTVRRRSSGSIRIMIFILIVWCGRRAWSADVPEVKIGYSGYMAYQVGEIVKGMYGTTDDPLDHQWQQRLLGGFDLFATVNDRLRIVFGPECGLFQSVYDQSQATNYSNDLQSFHAFFKFYLDQMEGVYSFGDLQDPFLQIGLGYFKFSYNRDVKSLGEYLFRATPYPGYIINDFASVYKRLPGLHVRYTPVENLKIEALLTSEVMAPVGDYTPSLIAEYGIGGEKDRPVFTIGAGVSFTRLLSVNSGLTTPHYDNNLRVISDTTVGPAGDTSIRIIDSVYYSFQATKVMARFAFDPKSLLGNPDMLGKEDLKLYAEGCILGTKNYPIYYDNILKRIPIVVGFNIPAFKLLDVLSVEAEWYDTKYSNNYQETYLSNNRTPLPEIASPQSPYQEPKPYPWYWDVYAARTIIRGLQVIGEVGRTHYFTAANFPNYQDKREECPSHGDWQFVVRAQYSF